MNILRDIFDFLFPRNCIVCNRLLNDNEAVICVFCNYDMPRTNFHNDPENPVAQLFWGRVQVELATSFFYFNKGSGYQQLIHSLKYKGMGAIGIELGKMFGAELKGTDFESVDFLVPVPLHKKKQRRRGYNQSEMIAKGMALSLGKDVFTDFIIRLEFTETQTRKSRYDRFVNVSKSFSVLNREKCTGFHILLVDDVVTTGSTLEGCVEELIKSGASKVSIATLAVA